MKLDPTRSQALAILEQFEARGAYSSDLLSKASFDRRLNFPLLQRMVKGTTEWRTRIDQELSEIVGKELDSFSSRLRNILRIAAYQFLFLKKVPKKIVIEESLALARKQEDSKHISIFRKALDSLAQKKAIDPSKQIPGLNSAKEIAQHFSHPEWIVHRWIQQIGAQETMQLCAANNEPWPVSVRTNLFKTSTHQLRKKLSQEGVKLEASPFVDECTRLLKLPGRTRLHDLPAFDRGFFQVQDESAALVSKMVDPKPGEFVIDLCSAPGGKTTHMAMLMENRGRVLALDSNSQRLSKVKENCQRLGIQIAKLQVADASNFTSKEQADAVLLDAPCSGLGVLGRKTDVRWAKSAENILELNALQKKLLNHAATLVKIGGRLVYSTCTVEPSENEEIIENFLKSHTNFTIGKPPASLNPKLFSSRGFLRTWPHKHKIGGAFAAVLIRRS